MKKKHEEMEKIFAKKLGEAARVIASSHIPAILVECVVSVAYYELGFWSSDKS